MVGYVRGVNKAGTVYVSLVLVAVAGIRESHETDARVRDDAAGRAEDFRHLVHKLESLVRRFQGESQGCTVYDGFRRVVAFGRDDLPYLIAQEPCRYYRLESAAAFHQDIVGGVTCSRSRCRVLSGQVEAILRETASGGRREQGVHVAETGGAEPEEEGAVFLHALPGRPELEFGEAAGQIAAFVAELKVENVDAASVAKRLVGADIYAGIFVQICFQAGKVVGTDSHILLPELPGEIE